MYCVVHGGEHSLPAAGEVTREWPAIDRVATATSDHNFASTVPGEARISSISTSFSFINLLLSYNRTNLRNLMLKYTIHRYIFTVRKCVFTDKMCETVLLNGYFVIIILLFVTVY